MNVPEFGKTPATKQKTKFLWPGSIILLLCLLTMGWMWKLHIVSEERHKQEIRDLLKQRADALNQKELSHYLSCFSQKYQSGRQQYADLKANASLWFSQFAAIRFSFRIVDIELRQNMAIVKNDYTFSLIDTDGESINITKRELLEIIRENEGWKISSSL